MKLFEHAPHTLGADVGLEQGDGGSGKRIVVMALEGEACPVACLDHGEDQAAKIVIGALELESVTGSELIGRCGDDGDRRIRRRGGPVKPRLERLLVQEDLLHHDVVCVFLVTRIRIFA